MVDLEEGQRAGITEILLQIAKYSFLTGGEAQVRKEHGYFDF